jgi:hypothetical protein
MLSHLVLFLSLGLTTSLSCAQTFQAFNKDISNRNTISVTENYYQDSESLTTASFNLITHDYIDQQTSYEIHKELLANSQRIIQHLKTHVTKSFTVHLWSNYDNYLADQQRRLGMVFLNSRGWVIGPNEFAVFCDGQKDVPTIAVHEFAHSVSLHLTINFSNNPRWLWEAVAVYEAQQFTDPKDISYLTQGNYPTLHDLDFEKGWQEYVEKKYFSTSIDKISFDDKRITCFYDSQTKTLNLESSIDIKDYLLRITDINGKIILTDKIEFNTHSVVLNFKQGTYIISLGRGAVNFTKKITIVQ